MGFFSRKAKSSLEEEKKQEQEIKRQELLRKIRDLEKRFNELEKERKEAEKEEKLEMFKNLDPGVREEILNRVKAEEVERAVQSILCYNKAHSSEQERVWYDMNHLAREAGMAFSTSRLFSDSLVDSGSIRNHLADYRTLLNVHCDKSGDEYLIEGDRDEQ